MADWFRRNAFTRRTGVAVTPTARAVGRAQKDLHDAIGVACRALLDAHGLDRRDLPKRLRKYVGTCRGSVAYKRTWRRDILDWLRYRFASPSLAQLRDDADLVQALAAAVLLRNDAIKQREEQHGAEAASPRVRRIN